MALATAAQVRAVAPAVNDSADTVLDVLIARADAAFARWCGFPRPDSGDYTMEAATYTRYPDRYAIGCGEDERILTLDTPPILSVTSVHVDPEQDYDASTLLGADEYVADFRSIELTNDAQYSWSRYPRANKIVVSAGFVPADNDVLVQACITQVLHWFSHTKNAGKDSVSVASGSNTFAPLSLLPDVQALLWDYRGGVP